MDGPTHVVENQPPEFAPRDLWRDDVALREALAREGGEAFAPQVAALAVFGNPSAKFGIPLQNSPVFGGRGIDLCSQGDPICSDGRNPFAHTNYETSPLIGAAADFIIGRL